MGRKKQYATLKEKRQAFEARFKAKYGMSCAAMYYRKTYGIPLSRPLGKGGRNLGSVNKIPPLKPNPRTTATEVIERWERARAGEGKPAACMIGPGEGRPVEFLFCAGYKYRICLSYAADRDWKGWRIK